MAGYRGIDPGAFTNAFNTQRVMGAQMRQADEDNAFRSAQVDRQKSQDQRQLDRENEERQSTAFPRVGQIATQISALGDPVQKRAAFKQAILQNGTLFDTMGMPHTEALAKLDTTDDTKLEQLLQSLARFAPQAQPTEVSAGASLVRPGADGNFETAYTAPTKPGSESSDVSEYKFAQSQGYKGTFYQYQQDLRRAGAQQINLPSGYRWNSDGSMAAIPGGPASKQSEGDKRAAVMFRSLVGAENQLAGMSGADTGSVRDVALGASAITAPMQSESFKKYEAAGLRWAANLLYLKSGATATPDEIRSTWKQFFPQPGEGESVKQQKLTARHEEMQSIGQVYGLDASGISGAAGAPRVGTVEDGYRFKGGDPGDPNNWEAAQ